MTLDAAKLLLESTRTLQSLANGTKRWPTCSDSDALKQFAAMVFLEMEVVEHGS